MTAKAKKTAAKAVKPLTPWQKWSADPDAIGELAEFISTRGTEGHLAAFCVAKSFNYWTARSWIEADPARVAMYARAREDRADVIADEIVGISDESEVYAKHDGEDVTLTLDAAAIARNRLRVDARKWVASKLKPRTYGDKLELAGEVGIKSLPDEQLKSEAMKLMAKLGLSAEATLSK